MNLYRYDLAVPLAALADETRSVVAGWDWSRGAFGHALSLPSYAELHPYRRYSYENFPCLGVLGQYPALRAIFDGLRTEKISFRLLRREPRSAYGWHTDQWKGPGVVRFQIPILSDDAAFLVTTDYASGGEVRGEPGAPSAATFERFAEANAGHVGKHHLTPGLVHYFDTTRVHTLVNPGPGERITLSFDLLANDWVRERFPEVRAEVGPGPIAPLPRPGALGQGLARAGAYLHPLRTRARHWLHGRTT